MFSRLTYFPWSLSFMLFPFFLIIDRLPRKGIALFNNVHYLYLAWKNAKIEISLVTTIRWKCLEFPSFPTRVKLVNTTKICTKNAMPSERRAEKTKNYRFVYRILPIGHRMIMLLLWSHQTLWLPV